jgi:hypothetical protein
MLGVGKEHYILGSPKSLKCLNRSSGIFGEGKTISKWRK